LQSYKTSYDNQILPLRDSNSSILKPAIVECKVDGKRDEKNKIKESFKRTLEQMEKMKKSSDFFNKNKKLRNALRKALSNSTFS